MWEKELEIAINSGLVAAEKIMEIYRNGFEVEIKDDNSPVTLADKTSDKIIRETLRNEFPNYSFLTEESEDDLNRLKNDYIWIVDPLDGTKDFVAKDDQFAINIALSYKHRIVLGVIVIPTKNEVYYAIENQGAYKRVGNKTTRINVNNKTESLTLLVSNFHKQSDEEDLIQKYSNKINTVIGCGSSLKACKIASGEAEISYRFMATTEEWDTAAPDIILNEAGGLFIQLNGERIRYNREDVYNREPYIMCNCKENILL